MDVQRTCPRCGETKSLSVFGWRDAAHTRPQSYCRECSLDAWRVWYGVELNRRSHVTQVARRRKRRIRRNQALIAKLKDRPCSDCGMRFPTWVMDFDHVGEKEAEVSALVYSSSPDRLRAEVANCDVVCANCHRLRTYARLEEQGRIPPR